MAGYTGPVILDCYDSQDHSITQLILNHSTNTSSTIYRVVRSSPNCATPWAGKKGTGVTFKNSSNIGGLIQLNEPYSRLQDIYVENTSNYAGTSNALSFGGQAGQKVINVVAKCPNAAAGNVGRGFTTGWYSGTLLLYNCIAHDCDGDGFYLSNNWGGGDVLAVVNCTSINNGGKGFNLEGNYGVFYAWNCYAANNTGGDFYDAAGWDSPSGWNASKDNTSDFGGTATYYKNGLDLITSGDIDSDGLATADDLYDSSSASSSYGRNPYNDFSATNDFLDFLKNDAAGETLSKKDICGTDRPDYDTADSAWNVGASQATGVVQSVTITPAGGAVLGGAVSYSFDVSLIFYPTGGAVFGKTVSYSFESTITFTPSGGAVFGGSADATLVKLLSVIGGVVFGGDVDQYYSRLSPVSGGAILGGSDHVQVLFLFHTTGGMVLGGTAVPTYSALRTMIGGAVFGGGIYPAVSGVYPVTGGMILGGSADMFTVQIRGGMVLGGDVVVDFNKVDETELILKYKFLSPHTKCLIRRNYGIS